MQKLAIIGYGQMGKLIDSIAKEYGFEVVSRIDPALGTQICKEDLNGAEVAIEFTQPEVAVENIKKCVKLGIKLVCGTTGWNDKEEDVEAYVNAHTGSLIHAANFSLGMNIFYQIVESAAELMNRFDIYDVYGFGKHHKYKKDSPSGTAKQLAEILLKNYKNRDTAEYHCLERQRRDNEIHFASLRGGEIPGEHCIGFDSMYDSIELKHTARNRNGLAVGALLAAKFIADKTGMFNFRDVIGEL